MKRKITLFLTAFLLLACSIQAQNLDIRWLDRVNGPANPRVDKGWQFVSNSMAPVGLAVPVGLFAAGWARNDQDMRLKSVEVGASFLLSAAISSVVKISIRRPRPFVTYPDVITKKSKGGGFSFPSGHTTVAFATATSLSLAYPKWYVVAPSFAYAGAVAYSRMYLGVHFPSDLLGGMLVGIGTSVLVFQVGKWLDK